MINLISDTVTLPSKAMMEAMQNANLGDDVFGADPSVNELQNYAADLFGMEAALFCPSGTMTNQIAIKVHTQALDEMICDHYSHVYQYESSGFAFNSGISVNLIQGKNGKITAEQIEPVIKEDYDWLPKSSLVVLENTCNKGGGSYYTLEEIKPIQALCQERGLSLHLDGARLFNALVETNESPKEYGKTFDSISICLSKGLGAPVGSLLIGNKDFIKQAKRFRKVMGGGMRQAGILAAAGLYALKNNVERLKTDNDRAKELGKCLSNLDFVKAVRPVKSNIVIFDLKEEKGAERFLQNIKEKGILASAFGPGTIRFVLHMDISQEMHKKVISVLNTL
jgi:threonine aldolase